MSVAFDAQSSGGVAAGSSATWNHVSAGTPTAVGVGVLHYQDGVNAVPSVTFGGVSMGAAKVQSAGFSPAGAACRLYIFGLVSPGSGTQAIVVTSDAGSYMVGGAITVTGSDTSTVFSNTSPNTAASGLTISTTCTSAIGELVMDILGADFSSNPYVPGGSQTTQWGPLAEGGIQAIGSTAPGSATVAMSWTFTNASVSGICAASFKAAGAGDTLSGGQNVIHMHHKKVGWSPLLDHRRRVLRPDRRLWLPSNRLWVAARRRVA